MQGIQPVNTGKQLVLFKIDHRGFLFAFCVDLIFQSLQQLIQVVKMTEAFELLQQKGDILQYIQVLV